MLKKTDNLIEVILYSSHVCDFIYQREDGTYYAQRKNHEEWYQNVIKDGENWIFTEKL